MRKIVFLPLMAFALLSCKEKSKFLVDVHELDFRNKTSNVIHGQTAISEIPGVDEFVLFDTLLIFDTNDPSGQLKVYSKNSYRLLGAYCPMGRARNEFINTLPTTDQIYYNRQGHVVFPVMDKPDVLKEVDITESLTQGYTVVLDVRECLPFNKGVVVYLDNNLDYKFEFVRNKFEAHEEKNSVPSIYRLIEPSGKETELEIFSSMVDNISEKRSIAPYSGTLYKHPDRNIVVQNFSYMEYLLFFDFDKGTRFAIHQKDAPTFDGVYEGKGREDYFSFTDAATSDKYFMIIYWRGDYFLDVPKREGNNEVLVFDWNGKYITGFKMDRKVSRIEYDESRHILYALDATETLYAYDLNGKLP